MSNQQLTKELRKPGIIKFKNCKVYSSFRDNILGTELANMQLIRVLNKGIQFLPCAINIYNKYVWVVPLKHKYSNY